MCEPGSFRPCHPEALSIPWSQIATRIRESTGVIVDIGPSCFAFPFCPFRRKNGLYNLEVVQY